MFTAQQQVLLQAAATAVIVFFLAMIGGIGAGSALVWGLLVGFVMFLVLRQNVIVGGGADVIRDVYSEHLKPAGARIADTFGIDGDRGGDAKAASGTDTKESKPETLGAPRGGQADDLKRINGIGPKLEAALNEVGIYHLDQIAAWGSAEVAWADENLAGFKGQASRSDWVGQAKALLSGS